ncbi:hypothetical protein LTR37_012141 [Vermiconidia calcicola]|uniref:Uncharacterized protein n=1 Tax=Vermiconidia calcicola TaxID=1690605 RepID=A0ACC3N0W9_9PEZI|nr:hypothetical protein LTR37_012141 [Vermiconidia calcicola]
MIRTHRPRGHIWTHASPFQQTEEFRNICYEESIAPPTKVLFLGADDSLPGHERAAKRRRIEKLADDFLNGEPLFISSARPCSDSLKATIAWNKKSSDEPKFVLPAVDRSNEPSAVWEDVEDDAVILRRAATSKRSDAGYYAASPLGKHVVTEVQAQASYGRTRKLKAAKLTVGPSDEALRVAAALRARRLHRLNSEIPGSSRRSSRLLALVVDGGEPRSEPRTHTVNHEPRDRRTSSWLSRRKSHTISTYVDDDSADELRLSRIETPSPSTQRWRPSSSSRTVHEASPRLHSTYSGAIQETLSESDTAGSLLGGTASGSESSEKKGSYHTAPEETELQTQDHTPQEESEAHKCSQAHPLQNQGIPTIQASWACVNDQTLTGREEASLQDPTSAPATTKPVSAIRRSLHESAKLHSGKATRTTRATSNSAKADQAAYWGRRTRSSAKQGSSQTAVDTNLPVDQQRYMGAFRRVYTSEEAAANGSTPFMFRKRGSGVHSADNTRPEGDNAQVKRKGRRRVTFPSSVDTPGMASTGEHSVQDHPVDSNPPILDVSFAHDSSFAPKLNMALVDEHLSSILPSTLDASRTPLAIKKALRRELRNSGADITRCASEPPPSSQQAGEEPAQGNRSEASAAERAAPSQFWPGTQVLLNQAQHDLFTSPEKQIVSAAQYHAATPIGDARLHEEPTPVTIREPLRQLSQASQDPMPSTQQLMEQFQGFSTVKKPRGTYKESPLPTPTNAGRDQRLSSKALAPSTMASTTLTPLEPVHASERRSSSLRFPISSTEPPTASSQRQQRTPAQELSTASIATPIPISIRRSSLKSAMKSSAVETSQLAAASTNDKSDPQSQSSSSAQYLPSFQAAQREPSQLSDPDLDRTVDELTTELLWTKDLEGVLSQVA